MGNIKYGIAKTDKDFIGLKKLAEEVFDREVSELAADLFYRSPKRDKNIYFYAYDEAENKYVGILCLLDTPVNYGEIEIKAAEYGIAGTLKDYRNQGINNKLTKLFLEKSRELGYELIIIEGIPYFYRRYGFNYAVPMTTEKLNLEKINADNENKFQIRKAENKDLKFLFSACEKAADIYGICKVKDKDIIEAQLVEYKSNVVKKKYYILENEEKRVGFFALNEGEEVEISDISPGLTFSQYKKILSYFEDKGYKEITTDLKEDNKFIKYIKSLGSQNVWKYSYQLKITDQYRFLQKIKPVLEKRLRDSIYRNEKIELNYYNYQELIKFVIEYGKIDITKLKKGKEEGDFGLTPQGAVKLFFGEKTIEEIADFLPDCYVSDKYRDLVGQLFPLLNNHFYVNY